MWLAIALAVVALALVLLVVVAVHAWARFRRMNRFGRRAGERVSTLAGQAAQLGERIDGLAEQTESVDERTQLLTKTMAARTASRDLRRRASR